LFVTAFKFRCRFAELIDSTFANIFLVSVSLNMIGGSICGIQVHSNFFMLYFTMRIIAKKIIFYLMSINNSIYVFWSGCFFSWIIENSSYNNTEMIQKEMYVSGTDESKWRERYSSTPRYLRCSTHPSFLSILASSIFVGLQRRSIWIDVRNEIHFGLIQELSLSFWNIKIPKIEKLQELWT